MKLIVGLGNPGPQYACTRHNAGFMVLHRLATRRAAESGLRSNDLLRDDALPNPKLRFHSRTLELIIHSQKCLLMQPMTYMNRSGLTAREVVDFFKVDPTTDFMVVVDDFALPLGKIRLRKQGGAGGHNGLADIERALATKAYPRLRIGIDAPDHRTQVDYVLSRFTPDQTSQLLPALDLACDAIECWLQEGIEIAMSRFNVV